MNDTPPLLWFALLLVASCGPAPPTARAAPPVASAPAASASVSTSLDVPVVVDWHPARGHWPGSAELRVRATGPLTGAKGEKACADHRFGAVPGPTLCWEVAETVRYLRGAAIADDAKECAACHDQAPHPPVFGAASGAPRVPSAP